MIKQFETALATGQNLDHVRDELRKQADGIHLARYAEIDRSYNTCKMILFGITEPAGSITGSMARGYIKQCKKKYLETKEGKARQRMLRELMEEQTDNEQEEKGSMTDDTADTEEQLEITRESDDDNGSST